MYINNGSISLWWLLFNVFYNTAFWFSILFSNAKPLMNAQNIVWNLKLSLKCLYTPTCIRRSADIGTSKEVSFLHEILNKSASSRPLFLLHLAISYKVNWFVQFFFLDSRCRHRKYAEVFCLTFFSHESHIIGFSLMHLPQNAIEAMESISFGK